MDGREVTQLLQARGWYGVFVRVEDMEPAADGEAGLRERARLHVQLRPLVGWTSVEGGFQGLYYYELFGRLHTATKISEDHTEHLGDICVDEVATIRTLLMRNVLDRGKAFYERLQQQYSIELTEDAETLLKKRRIPLPHPIDTKE